MLPHGLVYGLYGSVICHDYLFRGSLLSWLGYSLNWLQGEVESESESRKREEGQV